MRSPEFPITRRYATRQMEAWEQTTWRGRAFSALDAAARWRLLGDRGAAIRDCLKRSRNWSRHDESHLP